MSTVRILPLGVPVAVGLSAAGYGAIVALALLGLLVTLLAVRAIRRPGRTTKPVEGPRA